MTLCSSCGKRFGGVVASMLIGSEDTRTTIPLSIRMVVGA